MRRFSTSWESIWSVSMFLSSAILSPGKPYGFDHQFVHHRPH